jgi:hypothetical protein
VQVQCRETRTPPLTEKEPRLDDTPPPVDPDTYDQRPTIVSRSQVKAAMQRQRHHAGLTCQQEKEKVST